MNIYTWIGIGVSALSIIADLILSIMLNKKNIKLKYAKIMQQLPSLISNAEAIIGGDKGVNKLAFVLSQIAAMCVEQKVQFNSEEWTYEIESILETPQKNNTSK